ncbi:MAG TPA: transposase [Gemmataceae bacterium]|nr:transposase [Gemmataceae bacterium]
MDRYWFLTSTTYGTWLPGDERGFVGETRDEAGAKQIHNLPGTPVDSDLPFLEAYARGAMKGPPIYLVLAQAEALLAQFQETARYRNWLLLAVGIMANHIHIVVGVPGDPDPSDVLGDFKSYGSRALNRQWGKPVSDTWWTASGSKRKLRDEQAIRNAIQYVRDQEHPLVIWVAEGY